MPERLRMSEIGGDSNFGAVALHQLIDATAAHVEYVNAEIELFSESN